MTERESKCLLERRRGRPEIHNLGLLLPTGERDRGQKEKGMNMEGMRSDSEIDEFTMHM